MKVLTEAGKLRAIGKTIEAYDAESIGFLRFSAGAAALPPASTRSCPTPKACAAGTSASSTSWPYTGVDIRVCSIEGLEWGEMDFPADVESLNRLSADWS